MPNIIVSKCEKKTKNVGEKNCRFTLCMMRAYKCQFVLYTVQQSVLMQSLQSYITNVAIIFCRNGLK